MVWPSRGKRHSEVTVVEFGFAPFKFRSEEFKCERIPALAWTVQEWQSPNGGSVRVSSRENAEHFGPVQPQVRKFSVFAAFWRTRIWAIKARDG